MITSNSLQQGPPLVTPSTHLPWLTFVLCMFALEHAWGARFYTQSTTVGHDFAGLAPALIDGKLWIDSNGFFAGVLNPPWFTPAFCAGQCFYADPQSIFYSPIQLFALFVDPFRATHYSLMLFSAVAYWGSYALARRVFGWNVSGATFFAVLGVANAFVPLRSAVGQAGYHSLYLWTFLAYALCIRSSGIVRPHIAIGPVITVGLVLTAWIQFGFAGMLVPAYLAVFLLCCALVIAGKADLGVIVARTIVGALIALLLNASKLYESISLMQNFPRSFYELPGFTSLFDALRAAVFAVFLPSQWTTDFAITRLVNVKFTPLPHEWALQFGLGALVVFLVAIVPAWRSLLRTAPLSEPTLNTLSKWIALAFIVALSLLPILLMWNDGTVRTLLKQIPILNSAAWPMRWIVVLVPTVQVGIAFAVVCAIRQVNNPRSAFGLLVIAIVTVLTGMLAEPVGYYTNKTIQSYSRAPAQEAFERSKLGPINIVRVEADPSRPLVLSRNDAMFQGASQSLCYNPLYGYKLEVLPQRYRLRDGPALAADEDGTSLINNPTCLIHPKENNCGVGTGFQMTNAEDTERASKFVSRRPIEWRRPVLGTVFSAVSQASWFVILLGACLAVVASLRRISTKSL